MADWLHDLAADLATRGAAGLRRRLVPVEPRGRVLLRDGRELLNFAGNDYLGLAQHPRLQAAAVAAIQGQGPWPSPGTGGGASRLVAGTLPIHLEAERRFAALKHAPAGLLCPTGYMANLAAVTALAGPGDLLCLDKLCHASLIDAAKLSGATLRVFPHLGYDKLERLLRLPLGSVPQPLPPGEGRGRGGETFTQDQPSPNPSLEGRGWRPSVDPPGSVEARAAEGRAARRPRRFIVTDSVFSMDGDVADLPRLCELARRHDAVLIVDEAHGTGVLGETGAGLAEVQGVAGDVDVMVSTASKALGGMGGMVTAAQVVIDTLVNHARAFIYTTAPPPAQAAALLAALEVVRDEPDRRRRLGDLAAHLRRELARLAPAAGFTLPGAFAGTGQVATPILPVIVGSAERALALAAHLDAAGLHAPAIRPPAVPHGASRVRLTLRSDHEPADVERLLAALASWRG